MTLVKIKEFLSFCSGNGGGIARALRDLTCSFDGLVRRDDRRSIRLAVKAAVRCLLLTANAADNKHHSLAKSLSMFETSAQKTNWRHPTSLPNTNEVECMLATSLHDLLCTTVDWCTTHAHSTSCRSRPAGLVTSFTRSFGLARLDLNCWRWLFHFLLPSSSPFWSGKKKENLRHAYVQADSRPPQLKTRRRLCQRLSHATLTSLNRTSAWP